jgi:uncharacterized membrane-anchored protein
MPWSLPIPAVEVLVYQRLSRRLPVVLLAASFLVSLACFAQADAPQTPAQKARHDAREAAQAALVRGPSNIALRDQATLALPEHFGFIPRKEAAALMATMGNRTDDRFLGLIVPLGDSGGQWFVDVEYEPSGYVKDDDAKNWDAQKLLNSLKEGTEAANEDRAKAGIPPIVVTRWIEPPAYEPKNHQLVWSAEAKLKNGEDKDPTVNYNTYLLGREGYVSLNLITSASGVDEDKAAAHTLLTAVNFNKGKQYADFNSSTDKVAAYGLAALVAGVAVKKLGLLALLAATVVKFSKLILIAVAGFIAAFRKWFKRGEAKA